LHEHALVRSSQYSSFTLSSALLGDLVPQAYDPSALIIREIGSLQNLSVGLLKVTLLITVLDTLEVPGNRLVLVRTKINDIGRKKRSRSPARRSNSLFTITVLIVGVEENGASPLLGSLIVLFGNSPQDSGVPIGCSWWRT
jgi:hypothetical protein